MGCKVHGAAMAQPHTELALKLEEADSGAGADAGVSSSQRLGALTWSEVDRARLGEAGLIQGEGTAEEGPEQESQRGWKSLTELRSVRRRGRKSCTG